MMIKAKMCLSASFATAAITAATPGATAAGTVRVPMVCSRGSGDAEFVANVLMPATVAPSSKYAVRIDGVPSKKIAHFGLNYIYDIMTDYALPAGATYVPGSAHVIPDTGTPNVSSGARIALEGGLVRLTLPAHVANGTSYTPPSIEFQLEASGPPGTVLPLSFSRYHVTANAIIAGDVRATCESVPKNYTIGTTVVTAAP